MDSIVKGDKVFETELAGKKLIIETGNFAMQASGAVMLTYGDTVLMATAVVSDLTREGMDYFPLMVEFLDKTYAAGKISGSRFIKREGRPSEEAVLTSRLIDRPIRPLFPKGYRNDVQVIVTPLSFDKENDPDFLGIIAASAALSISGAPFEGPIAASRIGIIDGKLALNPTISEMENSTLDLVVAGTKDGIIMVESAAKEIPEDQMVEAMAMALKGMQPAIELQQKMAKELGKKPKEFELFTVSKDAVSAVEKFLHGKLGKDIIHADEIQREGALADLESQVFEDLKDSYEEAEISEAFNKAIDMELRQAIIERGERPDGRKPNEIRKITSQVGLLPRTHGSALFTRGLTQALSICTLAGPGMAQIIDTMFESGEKRFMHHYNFPPYSVGESKPLRGVGRREIGHGNIAERSLEAVLPDQEDFPYTIRVVSEILSSNGSTSMAGTCGTTLALMDAGVPIKSPVAGIAMGLMTKQKDGKIEKYVVLSDIRDVEDFAGDMDFKVTGTESGITGLQMDMKINGVSADILKEALNQAKEGRLFILGKMTEAILKPREEISKYAPRVYTIQIKPEKIKDVIGKGGETINKIIAQTGVEIDIQDTGQINISAVEAEAAKEAIKIIEGIVKEPEIGTVYQGTVKRVEAFGAFVEILPGKEGLVHVSQISPERVEKVSDVLKVGDVIPVKLTEIAHQGRLNLSRKAALKKDEK